MKNFIMFLKIQKLVRDFFNNDLEKIHAWFHASNPNLGGISPNKMLELGREEKLLQFIRDSLHENK